MILAFASQTINAQKEKTVELKEVTVEAARKVYKADGQIIIPSKKQINTSTNGYNILNKLALPTIRVDEVTHTITALGNQGKVQIRINGTIASKADLLAMDPKLIKYIDFIDNPGIRYGEDIAYVINIKTNKNNAGYTTGVDLANAVTTKHGNHTVYAKWNNKKSELGLTYNFSYQDFKGNSMEERADYLLTDGSDYTILRNDENSRSKNYENMFELKYNLADSTSYVFQASLSGDFNHNPGGYNLKRITDGKDNYMSTINDSGKDASPVLDLYYFSQIGKHQTVTINMVGTNISTDEYNYNNEGTPYKYTTDGNTWSLMSEAIYGNQLKPFTMSFGIQHNWKYTKNAYHGDVESVNLMHNSGLYLFGEIKGNIHDIRYTAGLGVSNQRYSQETYNYNFWLFRPKAVLTYPLSNTLKLNYVFTIYQHVSQIAMISDTRIRQNSMEWTVGNPNIKPNRVTSHFFRLSYTIPHFSNNIDMEYRLNRNPNLASYYRTDDNQFMYTQKNQPSIDMLYVRNSTNYDIIPDKISFSVNGGIYRYFNRGDDYHHYLTSYNIGGSLQTYLGKWTLTANVDNGWKFMEGESMNHQGAATYLTCSYHIGNCDLSLYWQHPFQNNPQMNKMCLENRYIHKTITLNGTDYGNMITLNFAWRLNHGHKYQKIDKTMNNRDTQTGIISL